MEAAKRELKDSLQGLSEHAAIYEARQLVRCAEHLLDVANPLGTTLRRCTLLLEVQLPRSADHCKRLNELKLQKLMCAFLIQNGIYAYGTKFGSTETDLYLSTEDRDYVIETKRYPERRPPSEQSLKRNLVQLENYMDQRTVVARWGIFVIFNFSDRLLSATDGWLHGRYWILPINLGKVSPSKRQQSLIVEEGRRPELIRILRNES